MKVWHALAAVSGSIVTVAMALASVSYNATLGSGEPAFGWLPALTHKSTSLPPSRLPSTLA